eukprot:166722_1
MNIKANPGDIIEYEYNSHNQLPQPWMLTAEEVKKYSTLTEKSLSTINFMNENISVNDSDKIMYLCGNWTHKEETSKHKWGLIATLKNSHLIIQMQIGKYLNIGYLKT